ncbi:MAG: type II toxin-antitoxin system VapC family toxin [Caldilineaceae bacterium]|nr:type II toxin-antitoxin system VapC family toxin [Caldilineaceae bacterium]
MKVLLDTHTLLWFIFGDLRLSPKARAMIADGSNTVLLSTATLWEIAIKVSLSKLELQCSYEEFLRRTLYDEEFSHLSITLEALSILAQMPHHHRDPFDRLLIAQAISQRLPIVTRDPAFADYPIEIIW